MRINTSFFFFACGSSAPVRVGREGGAAAWLAGTPVIPSVWRHWFPPWLQFWLYQSFPEPLVIRRPLWQVFLGGSARSGTWRDPLPGVLLCCLAPSGTYRGPRDWGPTLKISSSGTLRGTLGGALLWGQGVRRVMGQPLYCSAANADVWRGSGYGDGRWWLHALHVTQQCRLASMAAWLSSRGVSHNLLPTSPWSISPQSTTALAQGLLHNP